MDLKLLISAGILKVAEPLQATVRDVTVKARLTAEGYIVIDGTSYADADQAMLAILENTPGQATSSGLQFWSWWNKDRQAWAPLEHARAEMALSLRESLTASLSESSQQGVEQPAQQKSIKTSDSHPLRFDFVRPKDCTGRIGMTVCPGKKGRGLYAGNWQRDLAIDLKQIKHWGATVLISLIESHEFELLQVPEFIKTLEANDLTWYHLPIQDMHAPGEVFEFSWKQVSDQLFEHLQQGQDIVIHCRGGLGRTGLLAARMLVEMGESPESAVHRVRTAREHAIETFAQEQYVLEKQWCKPEEDH